MTFIVCIVVDCEEEKVRDVKRRRSGIEGLINQELYLCMHVCMYDVFVNGKNGASDF